MGFYINHHLILHRQPGRLPNSSEDGGAHRVSRRPGRSDGNRVWHHARRIHDDLLPGQRLYTSLHMVDCLYSSIKGARSHSPPSPLWSMGRRWCYPPSSPSCPFCVPPLTTGFICFLSVLWHNYSISTSSGRWGIVLVPKRGTRYSLSSSRDLTSERESGRTVRNIESVLHSREAVRDDEEGKRALSFLTLMPSPDLE